jgi:hypothetical protein
LCSLRLREPEIIKLKISTLLFLFASLWMNPLTVLAAEQNKKEGDLYIVRKTMDDCISLIHNKTKPEQVFEAQIVGYCGCRTGVEMLFSELGQHSASATSVDNQIRLLLAKKVILQCEGALVALQPVAERWHP